MNDLFDKFMFHTHQERDYGETLNPEGWVDYGDDNLFPQYLIELYHGSPTHTALVNSIAQMIYGDGFQPNDLDARLAMQSWDMDTELRKAILDYKIQGGMAFEVIWSKDRGTIANVSHLPFENVRACEVDSEERVHGYKYSTDWGDPQVEPLYLPAFNPELVTDQPTQILYIKPFSPGSYYYPKPDYIGAIHYVELEREIGLYHINNIQNGLSPSFSIHFKNGIPSVEERNLIRNDIENQMTGSRGAGKVWITYSDMPEQKPDFEPIPLSDAHNQYQFLSEETTAKIMIGHRVTNPMMFGVLTPGKLGGGDEMEVSMEIFSRHVIAPARRIVTEAVQTLLTGAGLDPAMTELSRQEPSNEVEHQEWELDAVADALLGLGEDMDEEWELIDVRPVDYDAEAQHDALWNFVKVPASDEDAPSEQDSEIIRVRYSYAPAAVDIGENGGPSRPFCRRMVAAGKVYRKEDIIKAGEQAVNPGFGPRGSATYSIWLWKGGAMCHHFWERRTYLRRTNERISVNEARRIINALPVSERDAVRLPVNDPQVARRPVDTPTKGYLK